MPNLERVKMPNFAELDRVMDFIDKNPEQHYQGWWGSFSNMECGTTACFAGWATMLNGGRIDEDDEFYDENDNPVDSVSHHAQAILDLSDEDRRYMFLECNDAEDLREHIAYMKKRDGYVTPEPAVEPTQLIDINQLLAEHTQVVDLVR